jgi:hypothetical protein
MSAGLLRLLLLPAALLSLSAPAALGADDHGHTEASKEEKPIPKLSESMSDKTFSFNANVTFDEPVLLGPGLGAASIGTQHAIVFLEANGAARVRRWNLASGAYETVEAGRWTVDDPASTLCVVASWPVLKRDKFCMQLRVSGPVVAGHGTNVRALILGDIRPGNPDAL